MNRLKANPLRSAALIFAMLASVALIAPTASAASTPPIRFSLAIGLPGDCIAVFTDANLKTSFTLRSASGELKAQGNIPKNELWFCLGPNQWVDVGDKLRASDATYTRTFVVPDMSIEVDRVNDVFRGTGPAGRTVKVEYTQGLFGDVGVVRGARVGADGHWTLNPHRNLIGGLGGAVSWKSQNNDRVHAYATAPMLTVRLGKPGFSGWSTPFADVNVALDNTTDATGTASADPTGFFSGKFRDAGKHVRPLLAGDHLTAPSLAADADWIVPEIDAEGDAATDIVSGKCHDAGSSSGLAIVEIRRTGHVRGFAIVSTDLDGSFSFDFMDVGSFFADPANVKHGDKLLVRCQQDTGDWVERQVTIP